MGYFILPEGMYDTLDLFAEELRAELVDLGHEAFVLPVDRLDESLPKLLREHVRHGFDAVIAFNNLAWNLGSAEGRCLWEAMGTVYVDILMDHPFHFDRMLSSLPEQTILFVIDQNHVDYVRRYYPQIKNVFFLPHAGCERAISALGRTDPAAERPIDVLYAGNLSRVLIEQLIPDFGQFPEIDGALFAQNALERLIADPSQTTEQVIRDLLAERLGEGIPAGEEKRYITAFRFLDGFAVSFYREAAVRSLVQAGIFVHVLGLGWETCSWSDSPYLILDGKVAAPEVLPFMCRSKIVLNHLTWFKAGAHDRIFNGMLCGAAVVSDTSSYLEKELLPDSIRLYPQRDILRRPDLLPEMVNGLLSDDGERIALSRRGQKEARENHTFRRMAEQILTVLSGGGEKTASPADDRT